MALTNYQISYNGLTMGDNTSFNIIDVQGLESLDNIRSNDTPRARDHGEWAGTDYATGRDIILTVEVIGADDNTFRSNLEALMAATVVQSAELPLTYLLPGITQTSRQSGVKPRKRPVPLSIDYLRHIAHVALAFHASDFRLYDSTVQTASVGLPVSNGGVTWPGVWPFGWGATSVAGTVVCNNAGNIGTRPLITITGPIDNPTITNNQSGLSVTFAITLANADTLTIDLLAKTVLLNGTANRRNTMSASSQWWELAPGNTTVRFTAATTQIGSVMTIQWQSAWT